MRFAFAALISSALSQRSQPNIIWLQTDSMDGRLLDPTSDYYYKIYMDGIKSQLVGNGVNFAKHHTASPQCVPSRTSMLTSRYVHETGTTNNGQGLARSTKTGKLDSNCVSEWGAAACTAFAAQQNQSYTFLDLLAAAGYDLQLFARFDVGAGVIDDYPQHRPTGDGFHGGPSLDILARGANVPGTTKEEPYAATSVDDKDPYGTDQAAGATVIDFLTNHDPSEDKPFFLWLGLLAPHPPYNTNATYIKHVNSSAIDAPILPDRSTMHPYDVQMSILKNCFGRNYTDAQLIEMRTAYWGAVGEAMLILDDVLRAAKATGHLNNTVVLYTSDHGEMSMEHRMDYKNNLRDPSVRVPLIIAPFDVPRFPNAAGITVTNFTSHVDILPTLMDLAGAPTPSGVRGQSLVPLMNPVSAGAEAETAPRREYVCAEYHSNLGSTGSFMIRSGKWKLITFGHTFAWFNATAYMPQLFDLDADPLELTDVSGANPSVVSTLFEQLEAEFGGAGSIAAIDKTQMTRNYENFIGVWGGLVSNATALEALFSKSFLNPVRRHHPLGCTNQRRTKTHFCPPPPPPPPHPRAQIGGTPAMMADVNAWITASEGLLVKSDT